MAQADFGRTLENTNEIEITTVGRTTGRDRTHTVWFVRHGDKVFLLPVRGSDSNWYKNLRKAPTIRLAAGPATRTAKATLITDPDDVNQVVHDFRQKYGARDVKVYFTKNDVAVAVPAT